MCCDPAYACIEVRTDDAEVLRPIEGAEATGDSLFHFRHSDRAFTQIICERDAKVRHKAQHLVRILRIRRGRLVAEIGFMRPRPSHFASAINCVTFAQDGR